MKKLTKEQLTNYCKKENLTNAELCMVNELLDYKQIEEELGIDLITLFKAIEKGFYYKKDNEIHFCRWCVRVNRRLVETKPCYAVKETTLESCYYGDIEEVKLVKDAHYWDWSSSINVNINEYGKTWALTKEELER